VGKLTEKIRHLEDQEGERRCALLEGAADCEQCDEAPRGGIAPQFTVSQKGDVTTIARVTCPTAPRFWRWREVMWPRLIPREVVLPEDEAHEEEWKLQLAAAGLCGLFGLVGALAGGVVAAVFYPLAYLAGAWFTAHEVWERLRGRVVDIHFLMLSVRHPRRHCCGCPTRHPVSRWGGGGTTGGGGRGGDGQDRDANDR
jgi:hypothetical protein